MSRMDLSLLQLAELALVNRRQSSANNRQGIFVSLGLILTPRPDLGPLISVRMRWVRTSIQRRKRYGESGSPCLIPLVGLINPLGSPLTSKEYETDDMHSVTHAIHFGWKPNSCKHL